MPLEPMILNSILGTFKNMVDDCKQKEISGEDFDAMVACYTRMEELGQSTDDMNVFNGAMMQENIYGKFSDYYTKAVVAHSQKTSSSGGNDAAMLKQNIDALKGAVKQLEDSYKEALRMASTEIGEADREKATDYTFTKYNKALKEKGFNPDKERKLVETTHRESMRKNPNMLDNTVEIEVLNNPEALIKPILKLIELGEQPGMTFPTFLRLQIEKGLDKAMEGTGVVRDGLIYNLDFAEAFPSNSLQIEVAKKRLEAFDKLVSNSNFNTPDISELNNLFDDIEREFEPKIRRWNIIKDIWERMLDDLYYWSLSYCHFAPRVEPWASDFDPVKATIFTQNVNPGIFKEREKQLLKHFGISFLDIFKHETFEFEVKNSSLWFSQELIEFLIEEVYPQCQPFNHLQAETIKKRGMFHSEMKSPGNCETNPDLHIPLQNFIKFYNSKFGEGRYESKYPGLEIMTDLFAKPWNWDGFKY